MDNIKKKITGVLVTYHSDKKILNQTIQSIHNQLDFLYIIDNSELLDKILTEEWLKKFNNKNIELISLKKNLGVATAQNIGIKKILNKKFDYIFFSDQDTFYPKNYIIDMLDSFERISQNEPLAILSPNFDETTSSTGKTEYEIEETISSGQVVKISCLKQIGLMDEKLFIDWVDLEWCWRARSLGYKIFKKENIYVKHTLGDKKIVIFGKEYPIHSAQRNYYIIRNGLYLSIHNKYVNLTKKIRLLISVLRYIIGFTTLGKPHSKHLHFCLLGFWHGLIGKMEKYEKN